MSHRFLASFVCLIAAGFAGCNQPADSASAPTRELNANAQENSQASIDEDSGYLAAPSGIPQGVADQYKELLGQADQPFVAMQLAGASQQFGMQLAQAGDAQGYDYFIQSGKFLRDAIAGGLDVPSEQTASVFYNEACGLAVRGKTEAAFDAVRDALDNGFADIDLLKTDSDLETVRALDGFDAMLVDMEGKAAEIAIKKVQEELANSESFPFEFALKDITGGDQSLEKHAGKVMIVDVWGTWCPPCRAEIPSFVKLQKEYGDKGFQMIGLNYERGGSDEANLKLVEDYVAKEGINYPCVMGTADVQKQIPDFRGFPTTLFIDKTGKVRLKAVGLHEYSYLKAVVETLLEEQPAT